MQKKYIILFLLICCCFGNAYSQLGVKAGANLSTMTKYNNDKYWLGEHIGVNYDIPLSRKWFIQPELLFTSIGCNFKDDGFFLKSGHIKIYAIEFPLIFSYRHQIEDETYLFVDLGWYFRYALFGNRNYKYYDSQINDVNGSPFDAVNRFDTGVNAGIGIQKNNYYAILGFQKGISHAEKAYGNRYSSFRLSFGYKFKI
jgi:hypothetical protein